MATLDYYYYYFNDFLSLDVYYRNRLPSLFRITADQWDDIFEGMDTYRYSDFLLYFQKGTLLDKESEQLVLKFQCFRVNCTPLVGIMLPIEGN